MSPVARWIVGIAGLLFTLAAFFPLTVSAHMWTALLLGAVVGVIGFEAARRTASWPGALLTLVALWMLASSFVGGVQTGAGHLWTNLLTGLTVVGITAFVHETEVRPA
jgi:hypothetical protein